ncbi:MAG: hypothetical protein R6X23_08905 [Acidimicrobiia bacterium]
MASEFDESPPDHDEIIAVARGIATAVAPAEGLTDVQSTLLEAVTKALTEVEVDYPSLDPLGADDLAAVLVNRSPEYRQRIVHHMVLAELVLRPLPPEVADRVDTFSRALGIEDDFVRVARRYADGAFGLAWCDLRRSGFTDRWDDDHMNPLHTNARFEDPFDAGVVDPGLEEQWRSLESCAAGTLGRGVWDMYQMRRFDVPGSPGGAAAYLAQHDFAHVIADYGTNLEGELEVFAFLGRADPDPKGFAWLATVVGLFETGYVHQQGFLQADVRDRHLAGPGMRTRLADSIRRGKAVCEGFGRDLLSVDYHELADVPLDEARARLHVPPKSEDAIRCGSASVFDVAGMSEAQREASGLAQRLL